VTHDEIPDSRRSKSPYQAQPQPDLPEVLEDQASNAVSASEAFSDFQQAVSLIIPNRVQKIHDILYKPHASRSYEENEHLYRFLVKEV
jgi:hypothetical protein